MEAKQIECGGFTFLSNFDSANLARVEFVPRKPQAPIEITAKPIKKPVHKNSTNRYLSKKTKAVEFPDYEFNIWTNPDCVGTEFENSNRTWFHFGMTGGTAFSLVKLNIIDLNKQSKMYSQGMAPVYKIVPGKNHWERICDKPIFTSENNVFTLSFTFRTTENLKAITFFAFTYPFSYTDLQNYLGNIDLKMSKQENHLPKAEIKFNKGLKINNDINDAIYYHRETLCYSLENRIVDLVTISSHHNITSERESRLPKLFPVESIPRPFIFQDKKVIFISARVHPGETPSSFVMNGIINLLIQKDDPIAILLRRNFVFKLIPMLNPDGVVRGHYRTDTRGCNLNRYYLNPSPEFHPSIFAARALIRYHHFREEVADDLGQGKYDVSSQVAPSDIIETEFSSPEEESPKPGEFAAANNVEIPNLLSEKSTVSLEVNQEDNESQAPCSNCQSSTDVVSKNLSVKRSNDSLTDKDDFSSANINEGESELLNDVISAKDDSKRFKVQNELNEKLSKKNLPKSRSEQDSGLYLYLDMHGHASKKGVFMYGNHFEKIEDSIECMLFPKIMSVNSQNFHFSACNFTEKNMYLRDKRDGTSREGSGRVAVLRLTGLIRSYTLECNYNTGRFVNKLPQCSRDLPGKSNTNLIVPPKYSPGVYEEIGRALCISILDLISSNPWSRIPNSEYHTLIGIRDWLKLKTLSDSCLYHRSIPKSVMRTKQPNKSSQTQVEDFIALGFNNDSQKKLEDISREESRTCETQTGTDTNETLIEKCSEEEKKSDKADKNEIVTSESQRIEISAPQNSDRLSLNKQRAAKLLGTTESLLRLLECFNNYNKNQNNFNINDKNMSNVSDDDNNNNDNNNNNNNNINNNINSTNDSIDDDSINISNDSIHVENQNCNGNNDDDNNNNNDDDDDNEGDNNSKNVFSYVESSIEENCNVM